MNFPGSDLSYLILVNLSHPPGAIFMTENKAIEESAGPQMQISLFLKKIVSFVICKDIQGAYNEETF